MYSPDVYVVFTKATTLGFVRKFLHSEISHCFAIWEDSESWLMYDVSIDNIGIFTINNPSDIIGKEISIKVKRKNTEGNLLGVNTCVSAVKNLIGMRDTFILTPYQLYKRLNYGNV